MPRKTKAVILDRPTRASPDAMRQFSDIAAPNAGDAAPVRLSSDPLTAASSLAPIIAEIRTWHRQRVFAMDQRKRSDLALGAFIRTGLGWSRAKDKAENDKIKKRASDLIALGEKVFDGKDNAVGNPDFAQLGGIVIASLKGREHWDGLESDATKEMERLAKSLPVWASFGDPIKGFGPRSLGVIIGETGDLSFYSNPAKIWKRMGIAVMNGIRQGGLRKTASKEDWIAHGYNAKRRSFMYVIGDVLIKNKSEYRDLYLERKDIERAKAAALGLTVAPAAKIPAKLKDQYRSDGHIHALAQRYMEKRLLRNLWRAWRRASLHSATLEKLPAAESKRQTTLSPTSGSEVSAKRSAIADLSPMVRAPSASIPVKAGRRRASVVATSAEGAEEAATVHARSFLDLAAGRFLCAAPAAAIVAPAAIASPNQLSIVALSYPKERQIDLVIELVAEMFRSGRFDPPHPREPNHRRAA